MKAKILLSVIMSTVLLLVPCAFSQQAGQDPHGEAAFQNALKDDGFMVGAAVPSATASQATRVEKVNVHQLSKKVEKLIKKVEDLPLACETRNAMVRRLRKLDDALLSGRLSAARAMALAWAGHAWSLQSARVLSPGVGGVVQTHLGGMAGQIGTGWPVKPRPTKHWKPLPSCESGVSVSSDTPDLAINTPADTAGSYTPDVAINTSADIEALIQGLVKLVPKVGPVLSALVGMVWPASGEGNAFQELVSATVYDLVSTDLEGLEDLMTGSAGSWETLISNWQSDCETYGYDSQTCINEANGTLWTNFQILNSFFINHRAAFQMNESTDYRQDLLPLYAQYENLYLGFLRDGVLLHNDYWADAGVDIHNLPRESMDDELNPDFLNQHGVADRGIGYVNSIYNMKLPPEPTSGDSWKTRNSYVRNMTLKVLDFRDTWKYLDPEAYPEGVPGGVKLTRMIYSDPIGDPYRATPQPPSNVPGPLKELSLWTRPTGWCSSCITTWISAVQVTSPPTAGPATSGNIVGDQAQLHNHASYFNLSARGPIVKVEGEVSNLENFKESPNALRFTFADGSVSPAGSWLSNRQHPQLRRRSPRHRPAGRYDY